MKSFERSQTLTAARRLTVLAAAGALSAALAVTCAAVEPIALYGRTMGTTYTVKYWTKAASPPTGPELQRTIDALLAVVDKQMSTWRPDSELSRFNAAPANEWFPVSPATAAVVARALELHQLTGGASDVTVGPALRLWGFGPGSDERREQSSRPSDAAMAAAMQAVGARRLNVRSSPPGLRKDVARLEVDVSSLAAGFAIDAVVERLVDAGVANAMVELGGEVRGVGRRPDGKPWRIGIQMPPPLEDAAACVVPLVNRALATSGDFHNIRVIDGRRYTHIIDPRTGQPLPYRGASITVVAESCFAADGIATALFVMGTDPGHAWCIEHGVAALFVDAAAEDGAPRLRTTPRFDELLGPAR